MRQRAVLASLASWRRPVVAMLPLAALALAGCGGELYEERLANTQILFAHEALLQEHLQGEWTDAENGIALRVPLKFEMLPPPVRPEPAANPAGDEGEKAPEEEVEVIDDRQPKYLNVELPGLRGAFQAKIKVIGDNNAETEGDAWMYVMSNQDLADKTDEAKDFSMSFVKTLAGALQLSAPANEDFETARFPARVGTFVKPLKYTAVVLKPEENIAGLARQFSLYMHENNEVQVIVLFVLPQSVDGAEKFTERIPLCLETLKVGADRLVHKTPGGGGGATPKESF
jgi:hypothetical protein